MLGLAGSAVLAVTLVCFLLTIVHLLLIGNVQEVQSVSSLVRMYLAVWFSFCLGTFICSWPQREKNINSQRKGESNIFAPKHLAFLVSVIWCALANKAPRWICPFRGDVILGLFCFNIAWESSHCFLEQISALKTTQRRNTHQDVILSHIVRGDTRWNIPSVNRCSTGGNLKRQYYSQF